MKSQSLKIIISGGGTGGHIFPALAIADALKARKSESEILFIGAQGRMEMERVPKAGYPIKGLWISGFQRSLSFTNLLFPFKLIHSLLTAYKVIKAFKPDVVIGVGGYASGPTLRVAVQLSIPTLIQEQNSFPGITNRILGQKVNRICVAYNHMEKWFPAERTVLTGNPLRKASVDIIGKRLEAISYFNLNEEHPVVLIIGGSQGALAINNALVAKMKELQSQPLQLIWQTGSNFLKTANEQIVSAGLSTKIKAVAFIDRMDLAYAAADLIVSRAGAMSIAEISYVAKPAILIPLPSAAEDHQTKNAMRLVEKNAARLIRNENASEQLIPQIIDTLNDTAACNEMRKNIKHFAQPEATNRIVEEILKLAQS